MNAYHTTRDQAGSASGLFTKISILTSLGVLLMCAGVFIGAQLPAVSLIGAVVYLVLSFVAPAKVDDWPLSVNIPLVGLFSLTGGTVLGPLAAVVSSEVGTGAVIGALAGCTGVMILCGLIAQVFHWVRFERMAGWLLIALLVLLAIAVVGIFVTFSSGANLVICGIGALVSSLLFLVYFGFAMREADNTWQDACVLTMGLMSALVTLVQYVLMALAEIAKNQ